MEMHEKSKASGGSSGLGVKNGRAVHSGSGTNLDRKPIQNSMRPSYFLLTRIVPVNCRQRVEATEATIIIVRRKLSAGSLSIREYAAQLYKPCIVVQFGIGEKESTSVSRVSNWIKGNGFMSVLVAVSREIWGNSPKPYSHESLEEARVFLHKVSHSLTGSVRLTEVDRIIPHRTRRDWSGRLYRHGDLLIIQIERLPEDARKVEDRVLAAGEHTGNQHELHTSDGSMLEVYEDSRGGKYFTTDFARLTHQEHREIHIAGGTYAVEHEREYDYFFTVMIPVSD